MEVFLQFGSGNGPFQTVKVIHEITERPYSGRTQTGYGYRMPTDIRVRWEGRWRRVYVCNYGNSGTAYIGRNLAECVAKVGCY